MANLIIDPIQIFQYLDIIMPNLKIALFDVFPERINAMSKIIGSLAKSLGENYSLEIITWLEKFLTFQFETVQKSCVDQSYCEIPVEIGDAFVYRTLPNIISKVQEYHQITKEG